jgi:hypothetical protein
MCYLYRIFSYLRAQHSFSGMVVVFLFAYFIYVPITYASIVLNEIYPAPTTGESEWIELYNNENKYINLSQYRLFDLAGNEIKISTDSAPPLGFVLANSSTILNNDGDTIRLKNNVGEILEVATYSGSFTPAKSFVKCPDGGNNWFVLSVSTKNTSNEIACKVLTPTPTSPTETPLPSPQITQSPTGEPTQTPVPTQETDYQNIFISEVYPYPESGEPEWVELYNGNNTQVDLNHWYIDDIENGGSAPKSFSLLIDPYSYGAVTLASSMFNNDGDVVRLLDSDKNEKDSMEYGKITQGKSVARISFTDDSYCEQTSSKNAANSSCILEPTPFVSTQTSGKTTSSIQKTVSLVKKPINITTQQTTADTTNKGSPKITTSQQSGQVLGAQTSEIPSPSPVPYLSFVSGSYSLLTIVSLFIKMRNAL